MLNASLSLDAGVRGLVLYQLDVPDFIDSPREALPFLGSRWGEQEEGREGEMWLVWKMNKKIKSQRRNDSLKINAYL